MNYELEIEYIDSNEYIGLIQDFDYLAIHPSQIDEVIQFLLSHKKQVDKVKNKE